MPLSELKKIGIHNPEDSYPAGESIEVRITALDASRQRISLVPGDISLEDLQAAGANRPSGGGNRRRGGSGGGGKKPRSYTTVSESTESGSSVSDFGEALAAALKDRDDS